MKLKLLLAAIIAATFISTVTLAQDPQLFKSTWDEVRQGKMIKKAQLQKEAFTLEISKIPESEAIQVYFGKQAQDKKDGVRNGNITNYVLNEFLEDVSGQGEWFIMHDKKNNKDIDSFLLIKAGGPDNGRELTEKTDLAPIAFYDADAIYKYYLKNQKLPAWAFAKYNFEFKEGEDSLTILKKNPFIDEFLKRFKIQGEKTNEKEVAKANSLLAGALANLSGIDVTKYVQATADFLRDRIKEELGIAFIEKFKATIEHIPELKALLPKTYNVFNTSDPFKVASLGQTYKTAFREDLENFIENFEMFIDTTQIPRYEFLRSNQVFTAFRIAYHTIDMSANDFHPIDIFESLDVRFGMDISVGRTRDINKYVSLLNLLSQNLRKKYTDAVGEEGWIGIEELKKFNPKGILLFWGLVYQQKQEVFEGIVIKVKLPQTDSVTKNLTTLILESHNAVQSYMNQFLILANNIDKQIKEFKAMANDLRENAEALKELAIKDFVANADKLMQVADFIFRLPYFRDETGGGYYRSDYYKKWRPVIIDAIETTKGIYVKDYAKIVINGTSLITDLSRVLHIELGPDNIFSEKFLKNFTFYSNFLVDAINADSADDVKAVLNRYAQPVGSYRVKRKTPFSISLNAYPGLYFGRETYKSGNNKKISNNTFGVTAPIGLSFNVGNWPAKNKNWSASIFLSAVDIAAALSFRWSNDTLDLPEKITLGQIFAPGAFFVIGFPKVPVSAKVGMQHLPQLRSITENGNKVDEINTWRFGVSVVVDIPIFNFYSQNN